jgi:hypothetical protein
MVQRLARRHRHSGLANRHLHSKKADIAMSYQSCVIIIKRDFRAEADARRDGRKVAAEVCAKFNAAIGKKS